MKNLTFFICSFLLMFSTQSCEAQKLNPDLYQRQWMLVSLKGFTRDFLVQKKAQLDLSPTKNTKNHYKAYMGCNDLFIKGEFFNRGKVKFTDMGATMMYCDDNKGLEGTFMNMISTMKKYKINGHQLTLSDGKGNEMKFVASDWD